MIVQTGKDRHLSAFEELLRPAFFKALADPNRLAILAQLAGCCDSRTVSEIAACCPVDLSVVSRHLSQLRAAGIVTARKDGRKVRYSLSATALVGTLRALADAIESCCTEAHRKKGAEE